jgi:hypothetical protein
VEREIGERSLGRYLTEFFDKEFPLNSFSKASVAISLKDNFGSQTEEILGRFQALLEQIKSESRD